MTAAYSLGKTARAHLQSADTAVMLPNCHEHTQMRSDGHEQTQPVPESAATVTFNLGENARVSLQSAETTAMQSIGHEHKQPVTLLNGQEHTQPMTLSNRKKHPQLALGAWGLAGDARCHALTAIRVNLAAAEKIIAMTGSPRGGQRRAALDRAIDRMTDAIRSYSFCPEAYIERGGLLARVGAYNMEEKGISAGCGSAASDFAAALWLDKHIQRRFQLAPKEDKRRRGPGQLS